MSEPIKAASAGEAWTVLRLLQWTTDFFGKRGSESPRLDAEVLLAHALQCTRIELYTAYGSEPSEEQKQTFRDMVRRRGEGTPVAYLVGYKEFYSLRFHVTPDVLIPRPETEHVVIEALDHIKSLAAAGRNKPPAIADVGTGSGAIAIAVAKHLPASFTPGASVVAVDLSEPALEVARRNAEEHGVSDVVTFRKMDLLSDFTAEPVFDLILSNPPYVTEAEYAELSPTVRDYEPRSALVAGPEGTEVIERLIEQAAERLVGGGRLVIELSPMIADRCAALINESGSYDEPKLIKDLAGRRRVLSAQRNTGGGT